MFTVKTKVDRSLINGLGVFSCEFVPKNTIIWKYQEGFDQTITEEEFNNLPEIAKNFIKFYRYLNKAQGGHILCADNARYVNHSKYDANILTCSIDSCKSIKDIEIGDEITEDYYGFDELAYEQLLNY